MMSRYRKNQKLLIASKQTGMPMKSSREVAYMRARRKEGAQV